MTNEEIYWHMKQLFEENKAIKSRLSRMESTVHDTLSAIGHMHDASMLKIEETIDYIYDKLVVLQEPEPVDVYVQVENKQFDEIESAINQVREQLDKQKSFTDSLAQMVTQDFGQKSAEMMKAIKDRRDLGDIDL